MKTILLKSWAVPLLIAVLLLSSCKKYDEGPFISLRSAEERISNTWEVDEAIHDGENKTSFYDEFELIITKDGEKVNFNCDYKWKQYRYRYETKGTWELHDNKKQLRFTFENKEADRNYEILKLREKKLWLKEQGKDIELHLIAK